MSEIVVSENTVKRWVGDTLTHFNLFHWSIAASPTSIAGLPDKMAIAPDGTFMALEIKGGVFRKRDGWKRKNATSPQEKFLDKVRENRGLAYLIGPIEAATLGHTLIAEFYNYFNADFYHQSAARELRLRQRHLQRIVDRGF